MIIDRLPSRVLATLGSGVAMSLLVAQTAVLAAQPTERSPDSIKRACKGQAQKIGLSVGDFGDVRFEKGPGRWTTRLNVQGGGEKFKARCDWDGRHDPRLTVDQTGYGVASKMFNERDVKERCRAQALSAGYEVGDFGDASFDGGGDHWVTTAWIRRSGTKYKARCTWDGFRDPKIDRLEPEPGQPDQRLSGKAVKNACKRQALSQGLQVGDFGDVDYDARERRYTTRMNVRANGRKYKATCRWDGKGLPDVR